MFRQASLAILLSTAAGAAFAAGPTPVPAEEVVIVAPAPVAAAWEGGYIGGQLGYAYGDFSLDINDFDENNVIGGLTAGYLWSLGSGWYLGPEFQYDWTDLTVTDPDTGESASLDQMARLKLILGYEVGNGLLFGSAGFAYTSVDGVSDFIDGSSDGYSLGLGYDWRMSDAWTLGGEYIYNSFDGIGSSGGDVDVNAVYLRAMYRF
ncbi:outer membrane protein [Palleronia sp. KMU-117]|uniref:outer membrane protein n=1 Tax=Palleronia sp. KMU-117 TaxID=3434108 RepID=UPI003D741777